VGTTTVSHEITYVEGVVVTGEGVVLVAVFSVDHELELGELFSWQHLFLVDLLSTLNVTVN
jgi:hypothetical protein